MSAEAEKAPGPRPPPLLGYAARAAKLELEPFSYEPPQLGDDDVRVSVTHCGVCYSDVHAIDDYFGLTTYPFVPGHEIVGHISEVGPAVTGLKKGDRVGIGWQGRSCMRCEWCLQGKEHLCTDIKRSGTWTPYGGFSSSVSVDGRFAYPLREGMLSEVAAVLLCAGIAVYSPLRSYAAGASTKVGVIGVGGLGHLAIQFAHALGCDVTAISSSPGKREQAIALGADHFMVAGDQTSIRQAKFSFDLLLYTSHGETDWTSLLLTIKNKGRLVMVGFSPVPVAFEPLDLVVHEQSITGSFLGSRAAMREMLSFAQAWGIRPVIELMSMARVNEAIRRVREGKARYRIVLFNDARSGDT